MPEVKVIRTIPQMSQLEIKFAGPLWSDMMVQSTPQLQTLSSTHLFYGKIVWVKDELAWFMYTRDKVTIDPDTGEQVTTRVWEPQASRSSITVYDASKTYLEGDSVYLNGKIYTALMTIAPGETPEMQYTPDKWLCISGVTIVKFYKFVKQSEVRLAVDINLPFWECWLNEDVNDETSPLYKAEPSIELTTDDSGVDEYLFRFYKDGEAFEATGQLICK